MIDSTSAELAVAGSILIKPDILPSIREVIRADDFHGGKCKDVFETACKMADAGEQMDAVTIGHAAGLSSNEILEITDRTPTTAHALDHAALVRDASQLRQLLEIGQNLVEQAAASNTNPATLATDTQKEIDAVVERRSCGVLTPEAIAYNALEYREQLDKGNVRVLFTGFPSIDTILGGLLPGSLNIVGARPGVGKTAFALAVADMVGKKSPVLIVSCEMTEEQLSMRRAAAFCGIPYNKLLYGRMRNEEYEGFAAAEQAMANRLVYYDCECRTVPEIGLSCQRAKPALLIIDYLQLLRTEGKRLPPYERVTQVSNDLKGLARRLEIPILCLAQLNRESESTADRRPTAAMLRDSGAVEQDADSILLLHRMQQDGESSSKQLEIIVAKNRHGQIGDATLEVWYGANRFQDDKRGKWHVNSWQ